MTEDQFLNLLTIVGFIVGVSLVVLNLQALAYFRALWNASRTEFHPERSWLLGRLWIFSAIVTLAVIYFLETTLIRFLIGSQLWTAPLGTFVIALVLIQPWATAREFRKREALARRIGSSISTLSKNGG